MSELTVGQLIKIILGVLVFVVVVLGLYFFFRNYVFDFFKNIGGGNETAGIILGLLK
jgi:hypothetical protein